MIDWFIALGAAYKCTVGEVFAVRAVFIDIDNTLVIKTSPEHYAIPESSDSALVAARQRGVLVFAATGRNTLCKDELHSIEHIPFDGYVGMNGSICHLGNDDPFFILPLDAQDVEAAFTLYHDWDFAMQVYTLRESFTTKVDENVQKYQNQVHIEIPPLMPKGFDHRKETVFSLMPYVDRAMEARITPCLKYAIAARWSDWAFDIIPAFGGKHVGMAKMMEKFGLKKEDVLAIGDGENDIGMLRSAGVGVAMSHASDLVKNSATYIAPEEDSIRRVFERFGIL